MNFSIDTKRLYTFNLTTSLLTSAERQKGVKPNIGPAVHGDLTHIHTSCASTRSGVGGVSQGQWCAAAGAGYFQKSAQSCLHKADSDKARREQSEAEEGG